MASEKKRKEEITPTQRMLNTWAIVLILWAVYRHHFKEALPIWMDEFIAKPAIFLVPLYYYILRFEIDPKYADPEKPRPFLHDCKMVIASVGLTLKNWKFDVFVGALVGMIFVGFGAYSNFYKHGTFIDTHSTFLRQYSPALLIAIACASAFSEEILARGFVLKRLLEEKMNTIYAILFNSFLYFFTHIPILFTSRQITGYLILQVLAMDIIFSVMVSVFFLQKRSTLLTILIHAFYNVSLYFFL